MKTIIRVFLLSIWLLLGNFQSQAADYAAPNYATSQQVPTPIEPIEPETKKEGYWKKVKKELGLWRTAKKQKSAVEPISKGLYIFFAIYMGLITAVYGILTISFIIFFPLVGLVLSLPTVIFLLYTIKLALAAQGRGDQLLKGGRFILGYISFLLVFGMAALMAFFFNDINELNGNSTTSTAEIVGIFTFATLLSLPILIFNIIDHLRFRKYKKEQKAAQAEGQK